MIDIKKPVIKSPKSNNNKLSPTIKSKLKSKSNDNYQIKTKTNFKKIKLTPKSTNKKVKSNLFIPTDLSIINKSTNDNKVKSDEVKPTVNEVKPTVNKVKSSVNKVKSSVNKVKSSVNKVKSTVNEVKPNVVKSNDKKSKKIKRRLTNRKKSTKNKTISVNLNNNSKKEKDIIELIDKFEKMDIKEIKSFLKNKGIDSKKNNKSKLLPYLYLLTCVDDDINIIKS
jgi:methyl-accepting chemotaxis protein